MTSFWHYFIAGLTLLNIVLVVWLLAAFRTAKPKGAPTGTTHVWDGDLTEYDNPLPRWWLWLFFITVAFSLVYLVVYPGLGAWRGSYGWTQVGQWREQVARADADAARIYARFEGQSLDSLAADPSAMRTARSLFAANCATCHGSDGRGARGFPNLAASRWRWGREPAAVLETIGNGRQAVMPAWQSVLGDAGIREVASYVSSLGGERADAAAVAAGHDKFTQYCSACHGADARGTPLLGAPDLTAGNFLYGHGIKELSETIANGRQNRMPAHLARLGELKVRLLAAYALSLAGPAAAAPAHEHEHEHESGS